MGGAVSAGLGVAGSLFGAMGGNNVSTNIPTDQMNALLTSALNQALPYSSANTMQAINTQQGALNSALTNLQQAGSTLSSGGTQALNASQTGFNVSQALQEPYRDAGYKALDMYMDTLGMPRAAMGSQAMAQALTNDANTQSDLQNLMSQNASLNDLYTPVGNRWYGGDATNTGAAGAYTSMNVDPGNPLYYNNTNPYSAPTNPTIPLLGQNVSMDAVANYIRNNSAINTQNGNLMYQGIGATDSAALAAMGQPYSDQGSPNIGQIQGTSDTWQPSTNNVTGQASAPNGTTQIGQDITAQLAAANMPYAQSLFNQANQTYTNLGNLLTQYSPQQQQIALAYNRGLFQAPTARTALY